MKTLKKITALLPMKGYSERVPNKNLKLFNGEPLFYHVLRALENSIYISKIIINTDSQEIFEKASHFSKVVYHERPARICGDFISMNDIIAYDLSNTEEEVFLQTHSTNPLLSTTSINKAIDKYFEGLDTHDSVFSVTKLQTRLYKDDNTPLNHNPKELKRTQDLEPLFEENSNFFIFSKESFFNSGNKRIGQRPSMFELNKLEAIDIDEPEDFILAEAVQKLNLVI